jgi:EamA-like transporter family.
MLAAALLLSGYNLVQRSVTKRYPPLQTTVYSVFTGTILLLVFLPQTVPQLQRASFREIAVIAFLGLFPSAIAYLLWSKALSLADKTSEVTNFMFVTPLLSMIFGYIIIFELPSVSTLIGGMVILFGFVLFHTSQEKQAKSEEN